MKKHILTALISLTLPSTLAAAVTVDGTILGDGYGAPVSVQTVETGFGDSDGFFFGSELDAAYAQVAGGKLYLTLTGNLEDNFNKLVVFFDSQAGGQNVLDTDVNNFGSNPVVDPSPFPPDPGMFAKMGLWPYPSVFDTGFEADYVLILRHGFTGSENRFDVDYAIVGGGASAAAQYLGVFDPTFSSGGVTGVAAGANSFPIEVGFDNSNLGGVVFGTGPSDPLAAAAVTTGVEIAISLSDLGILSMSGSMKITAFINNSNHDYVSNQFLGGLSPGQNNLGSDGFGNYELHKTSFDLSQHADNQYFEVTFVPEPSALVLAMASLLGWRLRRRSGG